MEEPVSTSQFLDIPLLLERSRPRRSVLRVWQVIAVAVMIMVGTAYLGSTNPENAGVVNIVSAVLMVLMVGVLGFISYNVVKQTRAEQQMIEAIEELVRLRRWSDAAILVEQLLCKPTRTFSARVQGLVFLTAILARYDRFEDVIAVQNQLLEEGQVDGGTAHGLRLARAMAMLRQDHLFDADRAISELRKQVTRVGRAMNDSAAEKDDADTDTDTYTPTPEPQIPQNLSAGLALIELYRDVKTGHPDEAIDLFEATLPAMRDQLGHRVADAHALVAKAYDLLGRSADAQRAYERATLLAPPIELHRRYPETAILRTKYSPAIAPKEAA